MQHLGEICWAICSRGKNKRDKRRVKARKEIQKRSFWRRFFFSFLSLLKEKRPSETKRTDCHDQSADWSRNDTAARCGTRSVDVCRGGVLPRPAHCAKQEGQNPSCLLFHPIAAPVILRSRRPGRRRCYPPARRSPPTAHGSARRPRSSPSPAVPAPPSPSPACCSRHRSGDGGP